MNLKNVTLKITILFLLVGALNPSSVFAGAFTATTSGSWSSTATWAGGVAPSHTLSNDQVTINSGVTVTQDADITISDALSSLSVNGTLSTSSNYPLKVTAGTVSGTGVIDLGAGSITTGTGSVLLFTGSITANTFTSATTSLGLAANLHVNQALNLTGGTLTVASGGTLALSNNGTIVISGGGLAVTTGTLTLTNTYSVVYNSGALLTGMELSGTGMGSITVNTGSGNSISVGSAINTSGTLTLTSGILVLNGHDLTIGGQVAASGTGTISSTALSSITINSTGGTVGTLTFSGTSTANKLTVNVGSGNQAHIGGSLALSSTLQLTSGTLDFASGNLTINGGVAGSGNLSGGATSNLTIGTLGGLSGGISFATGGQLVHDLTLNVGLGNAVVLGSSLTVGGTLALSTGSNLDISSQSLTVNGTTTGNGSLVTNASSSLTVNSGSSVSLTGTSIGTFNSNAGTGNAVTLGSNLSVATTLDLQSGSLNLNGHNLTVTGNVASNSGTISSTSASTININSATSTTGALSFTAGSDTVRNFNVNIGNNGSVNIGSDLVVSDSLALTNGHINIGNNNLSVTGTGNIYGADSSHYIITDVNGSLGLNITAGDSASIFPVGTSFHYSPATIALATGSSSGNVMVGTSSHVLASGTTGYDITADHAIVGSTWFVHSDIATNLNMNLGLSWSASQELNGFTNSSAYIAHYTNAAWDSTSASAATQANGMFTLHRSGITSMSPFAVFEKGTQTGIASITNDAAFEVYPNPTADVLNVRNASGTSDILYMDIISIDGQVISSQQLTNLNTAVSVSELAKGNYFVRLHNDTQNTVKKFAKI